MFVDNDGFFDARALTPFVGLVRHVRRAWTENDSRNTAEGWRQRRCVGEIGCRLDGRRCIANLGADPENLLHPGLRRVGPHALDVDDRVHSHVGAKVARDLIAQLRVAHPRDGTDIDPDLRPIRHRVDIDTAVQRADVQRGCAHHRMPRDIEIERLKPADGARGSIDGVNALVRHGTMSGDTAGRCLQPQRTLVTA